MSKSQDLYNKAKKRIPGGTQLLSKRPEMFLPDNWPNYYSKAKGVEVEDIEGNHYIDMTTSGIGACPLGFADPDVSKAVKEAVDNGSMSTLNCPEEVELADLFCEIHPLADMVRYTRTGGEAMSVAIRIARAKTGRDKVAFCGYHGWNDWYLAANLHDDQALEGHLIAGLEPAGVPRGLTGTALPFHYNKLDELEKILEENEGEVGVIVMEPIRNKKPDPGFVEGVRALADRNDIVLIIDEITAAWRVNEGGYHLNFSITPDIAVFGKAISNGHPMAAVIGKKEVMEAAQNTFISSTYWTERVGPVAALATLKKYKEKNICKHLEEIGMKVLTGWEEAAEKTGLPIKTVGKEAVPALAHFSFEGENPQELKTLFTQLMLEKGFLATTVFYATYSHTEEIVEKYMKAVEEVFAVLAEGNIEDMLKGPVAHAGFQRLN